MWVAAKSSNRLLEPGTSDTEYCVGFCCKHLTALVYSIRDCGERVPLVAGQYAVIPGISFVQRRLPFLTIYDIVRSAS